LARLWRVDPAIIPHWSPPTHAMQIFRYAEQGSIRMLWISGTNPVISLPDVERTRRILQSPNLFVIAQDAFLTETAELADLVLPAAIWGEKTGCFTNVDRTVHISHQAVDPPGEARSDFEIFLEYSRRMDFRDKDGEPLVKWNTPEQAFEAWKECTRGRPCDYTGISYAKLSAGSGIQWPCNARHPEGTERLYSDARFPTSYDECETFGHDLATGGMVQPERYRADDPRGKALLKAAEFQPPHEQPDDDYPLWLTTGRVVYHFHTRTKTGRSKPLNDAAPDAFVQISAKDAQSLGIAEGDMLEVQSRRGRVEAPARIGDIEPGLVFVPFHYGYWDRPDRLRAANELTVVEWDPISKQPYFKHAAVRVRQLNLAARAQQAVGSTVASVKSVGASLAGAMHAVAGAAPRRHVGSYVGLAHLAERELEKAFLATANRHGHEPDILHECELLADWSHQNAEQIDPFVAIYSETKDSEPKSLRHDLFRGSRSGGLGLLRDLHDLWLLASEARLSWELLHQAAQALHDQKLEAVCQHSMRRTDRQLAWLRTRADHAAAQTLTVPM
jgi:formylmethanofuran dehydrogenase subunit D